WVLVSVLGTRRSLRSCVAEQVLHVSTPSPHVLQALDRSDPYPALIPDPWTAAGEGPEKVTPVRPPPPHPERPLRGPPPPPRPPARATPRAAGGGAPPRRAPPTPGASRRDPRGAPAPRGAASRTPPRRSPEPPEPAASFASPDPTLAVRALAPPPRPEGPSGP